MYASHVYKYKRQYIFPAKILYNFRGREKISSRICKNILCGIHGGLNNPLSRNRKRGIKTATVWRLESVGMRGVARALRTLRGKVSQDGWLRSRDLALMARMRLGVSSGSFHGPTNEYPSFLRRALFRATYEAIERHELVSRKICTLRKGGCNREIFPCTKTQ